MTYEEQVRNELLKEIIESSHYCHHCRFLEDNHGECPLACHCITNDFYDYDEGDD